MSDALEARVKAIFQRALEVDAPSRPAFLDRVCEGSASLRARVDALIEAYDEVGEFLADPAAGEVTEEAPEYGVGAVIDRFRLLQRLGEGGFGTVYMAEQIEPVRRKVALKITKLGMDTKEVIARFEAERQALAMMDHPNIAMVLDAGATPSGRPYFVMELVRGVSITEFCDTARVGTTQRLELFRSVCDAVQHAHQKGVIHRDIKPSNVMVTLHDGVPVPKVIDFGIAKATDHRLTEKTLFTELHQLVGTPEYMAPEQAELSGLDVDTRADVYSLGVLLYELLTGTKPFDLKTLLGEGFEAVLRCIREVDPPKPSSRVSTMNSERLVTVAQQRGATPATLGKLIRGDLDWIVMKALEKDRTRRYDSASALAMDIARYQRDEPVLAHSPSAGYRMKKYVRRHRVGVGALSAIVLALVVGAVVAARGYVEADRQLGRALRAETLAQTEARDAREQRDLARTAGERADAEAREAREQRARAIEEQKRADKEAGEAKRQRAAAVAAQELAVAKAKAAKEQQERADREAAEAKRQREKAVEEKQRADREAAAAKRQRDEADRRFGIISTLMATLQHERGETTRERWSGVFLTGMQSALAAGEPADVFFFLEHARIDPLLGLMGSRDLLESATLPAPLKTVEAAARARVLEARRKYEELRRRGNRRAVRAVRKELEVAQAGLQRAILQTQTLARAVAAAAPALPVTLDEIQKTLRPMQAYVAFAVLPERVIGFVVTRATARSVDLGTTAEIERAVGRLDLSERKLDPTSVLTVLRSRLIEPLGLPQGIRQVLISPEGSLLAIPFGLLLSDRDVALTPSASTYLSLLERTASTGRHVLAVGDPNYEELGLARLPATRKEAEAIGSVVLLGKNATVANIRSALARQDRWRAVHLACHALVDSKRPLLSALAFTTDEQGGSRLTALDISQMEVDADIVSLPACDTAKGAILAGGGIGSLTRAFLYAGASRVLVSHGKLDDQAAAALATKFYELWNPKDASKRIGAAAALRAAQAFVRTHEEWKHPYYWGSWAIWGLVD